MDKSLAIDFARVVSQQKREAHEIQRAYAEKNIDRQAAAKATRLWNEHLAIEALIEIATSANDASCF